MGSRCLERSNRQRETVFLFWVLAKVFVRLLCSRCCFFVFVLLFVRSPKLFAAFTFFFFFFLLCFCCCCCCCFPRCRGISKTRSINYRTVLYINAHLSSKTNEMAMERTPSRRPCLLLSNTATVCLRAQLQQSNTATVH